MRQRWIGRLSGRTDPRKAPHGDGWAAQLAYALCGAAVSLLVWEIASRIAGNAGLFPPLERVWSAFMQWSRSGDLAQDMAESVPRALLSLLVATPLGVLIGLGLALYRLPGRLLEGTVHFLRSLPPVALLPLFILWFGIEWSSKLLASIFVCVFPVVVTTLQGARLADVQYRELARDLDLSRLTYIARVIIPATAPAVVPGIRLAAGTAFIMLYVSELAGASFGLGYRISISQLAYQSDLMIAGLIALGTVAAATDALIQLTAKLTLHYAGRT
jgi:sulfonate transport system permease protein